MLVIFRGENEHTKEETRSKSVCKAIVSWFPYVLSFLLLSSLFFPASHKIHKYHLVLELFSKMSEHISTNKVGSTSTSSSQKSATRKRASKLLSQSNPNFDSTTGQFDSKNALIDVQRLFVLDGSRRTKRKVKEIKAEVVTKERDPKGPSFTDELEVTVKNVENALREAEDG